ncbi:hypothetical protein ABZ599_33015 [Streptomyces misionensis]|uniref:hypothetical protein n=1 Tax=Streptomyces misionensis TaxID=67331 RepID=UPI0033D545BC
MTSPASVRWVPPDPQDLPEWRAQLMDSTASEASDIAMRETLRAGRCTIVPTMRNAPLDAGTLAATVLNGAEHARLSQADLYYATADMTALALAAAATPPRERVSTSRLPSESGFIVFEEPIGGYVEDVGAALAGRVTATAAKDVRITTPIVAASWTAWTPQDIQIAEGGTVTWGHITRDGYIAIPPDTRGIWITYYSPCGVTSGLPPQTVLGTLPDGTTFTAAMFETTRQTAADRGPLNWDNEMLLVEGTEFAAARPDTTDTWSHTLYTAWQLMTATGGTRWTETEEIPRARAGRKRDARQNITGTSAVRVVNVHTAHRPPRDAALADAAASTGRREPSWSCRWPVRPYRRSTCLNPGGHATGDCQHEDRIVSGHVKGPPGAPLRTGTTVHLWDHQPKTDA